MNNSLRSLHLIQNASAGVLTGISKRDHFAPILASFQWLPIKSRIDFKILHLTFKVLRGQAPLYLEKLIAPDHPNRPLSSESTVYLSFSESIKVKWVSEPFALRPLWCGTCSLSRYRSSLHICRESLKLIVINFIYTFIILAQLMFIVGASRLTFGSLSYVATGWRCQGRETWSTDMFPSLYWFMVACLHFLSPSSHLLIL